MLDRSGEISNLQRDTIQLNQAITGHFSYLSYRHCFEISPLLETLRFILSAPLITGRNDDVLMTPVSLGTFEEPEKP